MKILKALWKDKSKLWKFTHLIKTITGQQFIFPASQPPNLWPLWHVTFCYKIWAWLQVKFIMVIPNGPPDRFMCDEIQMSRSYFLQGLIGWSVDWSLCDFVVKMNYWMYWQAFMLTKLYFNAIYFETCMLCI